MNRITKIVVSLVLTSCILVSAGIPLTYHQDCITGHWDKNIIEAEHVYVVHTPLQTIGIVMLYIGFCTVLTLIIVSIAYGIGQDW